MIRLAGTPRRRQLGVGSWALVTLTVAMAALLGSSSALAATTARRPAPRHLFSIQSASASLTGPSDQHLTLRLNGARDHVTRYTDRRPLALSNVEFARRFSTFFAIAAPHAILTYTAPGAQSPSSITLTLGHPRWNARHHRWTFSATRVGTQPDSLPVAGVKNEQGVAYMAELVFLNNMCD
jgi:hypothetical protein